MGQLVYRQINRMRTLTKWWIQVYDNEMENNSESLLIATSYGRFFYFSSMIDFKLTHRKIRLDGLTLTTILVQKNVWMSPESRVELLRKGKFGPLFFLFEIFDHVSKGKFGPHLNCSKRQVWSRFGEKIGPNLPFSKHLPHVTQIIQKRQLWSRFFSESGPNLPFRTIWMWTKLAFWHVIINFEKKKKWTKLAFSSQLHTWLWTPSNTFLDQNIRLNVHESCQF